MNRSTAAVAGVLALLVIAVIAVILLSQGRQPAASPSPEPTEPTPTLNAELLNRRNTVLFVGIDLNAARESGGAPRNTDALLLASINADQSSLVLVSLPRDTVDVPLPDGGVWAQKINALYALEGIDALVGAMEELYGVPIDFHVTLDMDDFAALVEAVDGVTVNPTEPLRDPIVALDLQPGEQELDFNQALGYVRSRVDKDYGRMARQQEVIVDLVRRLVDPDRALDLNALVDGLDSLETDMPLEDLPTLIEIAGRAGDAEVTNLLVEPPDLIVFEGDRGDGRGYILEPDVEAIRSRVSALISD
jgi:LCP family protein required for cell wall assembly